MEIWQNIRNQSNKILEKEPILRNLFDKFILSKNSFPASLATILASKFADQNYKEEYLEKIFYDILTEFPSIIESTVKDLVATKDRNPACPCYTTPLLYYKGFQAIQIARIANKIWHKNQPFFAQYLQSKSCEIFAVDIHPKVQIGGGILLDHATSFVAGETAVIGNNVSILHEVTLGGSGKICGDRHPKVGDGVLIGAGAKLLGNIFIGENSKIGAGSVVLNDVPPYVTVVGIPAQVVEGEGKLPQPSPASYMDHKFI